MLFHWGRQIRRQIPADQDGIRAYLTEGVRLCRHVRLQFVEGEETLSKRITLVAAVEGHIVCGTFRRHVRLDGRNRESGFGGDVLVRPALAEELNLLPECRQRPADFDEAGNR